MGAEEFFRVKKISKLFFHLEQPPPLSNTFKIVLNTPPSKDVA
jgi:hypothetical protein